MGPAFLSGILSSWGLLLLFFIFKEIFDPLYDFDDGWTSATEMPNKQKADDTLFPGEKLNNIFWFIQVTDLHISSFGVGDGLRNFAYFLSKTIPSINPLFVVVTGDLTDAKERRGLGSRQQKAEWILYKSLLEKSGYYDKPDFWFDIRGNHDCFNVAGWNSEQNYFLTHSRKKESTYFHVFELPFGRYGLTAIDGCPSFGAARPFNFFGTFTTEKMDSLQKHLQELKAKRVRKSIIISHYPIGTMQFAKASDGSSFASLTSEVTAYLSGHLHRLIKGLGRNLYAVRKSGILDLELNDLKDNGIFRIASFDHDLFSFIDTKIDKMPFILLTNPVDHCSMTTRQDRDTILRSTHIRVLLFSTAEITNVFALLNGQKIELQRNLPDQPLFAAPWNPIDYLYGENKIFIAAQDSFGNSNKIFSKFRLDCNKSHFGTFGECLMRIPLAKIFKCAFWIGYIFLSVLIAMPMVLKSLKWTKARSKRDPYRLSNISNFPKLAGISHLKVHLFTTFIAPFMVLMRQSRVWFGLLIFSLLLPVGPLMLGCFLPDSGRYSVFTIWGLWHPDAGLTRSLDTWVFGTYLVFWQYLGSLIASAWINFHQKRGWKSLGFCQTLYRINIFLWWCSCAWMNFCLVKAYGYSIFFFGFGVSWHFIFVTLVLLSFCVKNVDPNNSQYRSACNPSKKCN